MSQQIERKLTCKEKRIKRLCAILDTKQISYDLDKIRKLGREKIDILIIENIDEPWQRFAKKK